MTSRFCVILIIVNIFGNVSALKELPQVEDNNILKTDAAVRETTNQLFSILKFKANTKPILKQYSAIHNYLVSNSLHDYTNLIEIAKLTRVDKTKLNNEIRNFMDVVNEILDEDVKHDIETEDEYIVRHIEGFLTNLDTYTDTYEYTQNNVDIILAEILKLLEKNETLAAAAYHSTTSNSSTFLDNDGSWLESSDENDTVIDNSEIWQPDARRIFEGRKVKIKIFPFMASVQIFNHFQCAGSIIKRDLIITAASCLQLAWNNRFFRENPAFLSVRVGSSFHNGGGEKIEALEVYFHPTYDPRTLMNNLCIIRLWRQIKPRKRTKIIEIDRNANALLLTTDGITIVGWGARRQSNIITHAFMAKAVLDVYPLDDCQDIYSKKYVTQNHFCAGFISKGDGACNEHDPLCTTTAILGQSSQRTAYTLLAGQTGWRSLIDVEKRDIGGPGIVHSVLTGIVSFGSPVCGTPDAPTVFTKLGFYRDWIDAIMSQKVPFRHQATTTRGPRVFTVPTDYSPKLTTFRVTPLIVTRKKKKYLVAEDVADVDTLRELRDEGLLKKFVDTVIGSAEAAKLLKQVNVTDSKVRGGQLLQTTQVERIPFTYSPLTTLEPYAPSTEMRFLKPDGNSSETKVRHDTQKVPEDEVSKSYENESFENQEYKAVNNVELDESPILNSKHTHSILDTQLSQKLEEDIVRIIDEIRLEDVIKKKKNTEAMDQDDIEKHSSNKNDDVTLLSVSEDSEKEKASVSVENRDLGDGSIESGLDIPADAFNDLTYRNNASDGLFISKQELLLIVSEAIKEEFNKSSSNLNFTKTSTVKTTSKASTPKTATKTLSPTKLSPSESISQKRRVIDSSLVIGKENDQDDVQMYLEWQKEYNPGSQIKNKPGLRNSKPKRSFAINL